MTDARVTTAFLLTAVFLAYTVFIAPTPAEAAYNACGVDFRNTSANTGHGGVEICGIGYPCGVEDGVCPQRFSQGTNETTKDFYTQPLIRGPEPVDNTASTSTIIAYEDGDAACERISATCSGVLESDNATGPYTASSEPCSEAATDMPGDKYYKADCTGVPNVAGCEDCVDPDCASNLTGYASGTDGEIIENVTVYATSDTNEDVYYETKTGGQGEFKLEAASGYFNITCSKQQYQEQRFETYVQPDTDTIQCTDMTAADCSAQCTAPNEYGNEVCFKSCVGSNGCTSFVDTCGGLPPGSEIFQNRVNETHVNVSECCSGPSKIIYEPIASFESNDSGISSLQVNEYRRELNGTPVTIKVATYQGGE